MVDGYLISAICDFLCLGLSLVFFWSTFVVLIGLIKPARKHARAERRLRFAVLVCARNEERVIKLPVRSVLMSKYPADRREVIVLADNCTDRTADRAREAGATVWEKTMPSHGKGDVLEWGIAKLRKERPDTEAIAVFDADNVCADNWLQAMNDALNDGETVVTGRRMSSNARANTISGWYTVYWAMMNELSNRVRTNLGLSGKLTGTGFAFLTTILDAHGWQTQTLVEDVEFTVQTNLRGGRIAYVPEAHYADEQPVTVTSMWRQLRRWSTGGWQVAHCYFWPWLKALVRKPSLRLFDSFFAILTGISVAFVLLFNLLAFGVRCWYSAVDSAAYALFLGVFGFIAVMGWFTAFSSVALSPDKRRPSGLAMLTFPIFSIVLSVSVLYTRLFPTKVWKPIPHGESQK